MIVRLHAIRQRLQFHQPEFAHKRTCPLSCPSMPPILLGRVTLVEAEVDSTQSSSVLGISGAIPCDELETLEPFDPTSRPIMSSKFRILVWTWYIWCSRCDDTAGWLRTDPSSEKPQSLLVPLDPV